MPLYTPNASRANAAQFLTDLATAAVANGIDRALVHEIMRSAACRHDIMDCFTAGAGSVQTTRALATIDAYNADPVRRAERGPLFTEA